MSLGLLITTCKHYFSNISNVIKDIEECNFPKENVLIVSGQEDNNTQFFESGIKVVKVDYTGLHLTGAIYLNENRESFKHISYWILLPDTIKLENSFYDNMMKYYNQYLKNTEILSLPFINRREIKRPTMDMGIVHITHIHNMTMYLNKIKKSQPYDINDVLQLKKQLIYDENTILGISANNINLSTKFDYVDISLYTHPAIYLINNTNEITERKITYNDRTLNEVHFTNIGLYKYQRNFQGPNISLIMEL